MLRFVTGSCLSVKVRGIGSCLLRALIQANPQETLKYFLPKICESIERILNKDDASVIVADEKENIELTWYLTLFAELVDARSDILVNYKTMIISVFDRCIHIVNKSSYEIVACAAKYLLQSLTSIYPIEYRLTVENLGESSLVDFLPIRVSVYVRLLRTIFSMIDQLDVGTICFYRSNSSSIQCSTRRTERFRL